MSLFGAAIVPVAALGGTMLAVAAAGVDSVLVPYFGLQFDFKLAVAAAALPHFAASALRTVQLRHHIDRRLFLRFGVVCAIASFGGAFLQERFSSAVMTYIFAALLVGAGLLGFTGILERRHEGRAAAWLAGLGSGFFGGLCGEQGGLRAVALMGFGLSKETFVATGAAVGLVTDLVRMPVYAVREWQDLQDTWLQVAGATAGVLAGVFIGRLVLRRLPQHRFARVVSTAIVLIGVLLFFRRG